MGGKNAIIIDDDADLDEAVLGGGRQRLRLSRAEMFGLFAGYRSAGRLRHVSPAVGRGDPQPEGRAGRRSGHQRRTGDRCRIGRAGSRGDRVGPASGREMLAVDVGPLADEGFYVGPHIFADVPADARLAQEEVFGPVLAVMKAGDLDEAFRIANGTEYALTGGIFSRSPAQSRTRTARVSGRQSLSESRHHRRAGQSAAVRRIQNVGHRHESRRQRLSAAIRAATNDHRKHAAARLCAAATQSPAASSPAE